MKKLGIGIIGVGRVGSAFAFALSNAGWRISGVFDTNIDRMRAVAKRVPTGAFNDYISLAKRSDVIFLTVPDNEIIRIAEELGDSGNIKAKFIFHSSGILPSKVLKLAGLDKAVYSLHPMGAVIDGLKKKNSFVGMFFGGEGDSAALTIAKRITHDLGGRLIDIKGYSKAYYHLAATIVSCNVFALFSSAEKLLHHAGISEEYIKTIILSMSKRALGNYGKFGLNALTGPVVRHDESTLAEHIIVAEKEGLRGLYESCIVELENILRSENS